MANKNKKAKTKAEAKVAVARAEVRQPVTPVASAAAVLHMQNKTIQPWHKTAETETTEVVTVNQEKFNRTGMDALMTAGLSVTAAAVETVPAEKKTVRERVKDGFLGLTRRMYRAGKNGQEILEANRDARIAQGYDEKKAMVRAKSDYGYVVREAKAENKTETQAVAV
jgi:hypothetical protein